MPCCATNSSSPGSSPRAAQPLARITAELDWWQARPRSTVETRATHASIADAADSMRTICETVLDDARADAHTVPGTADVVAVLHRLVVRLEAPGKITLTVAGPDTVVAGVPAVLLERIVAPLLDNALRYARTRVAIRVSPATSTACA